MPEPTTTTTARPVTYALYFHDVPMKDVDRLKLAIAMMPGITSYSGSFWEEDDENTFSKTNVGMVYVTANPGTFADNPTAARKIGGMMRSENIGGYVE